MRHTATAQFFANARRADAAMAKYRAQADVHLREAWYLRSECHRIVQESRELLATVSAEMEWERGQEIQLADNMAPARANGGGGQRIPHVAISPHLASSDTGQARCQGIRRSSTATKTAELVAESKELIERSKMHFEELRKSESQTRDSIKELRQSHPSKL
jgi:hypothetical protein